MKLSAADIAEATGGLLVRDFIPHVLIVDPVMPGVEGFDLIRSIRSHRTLSGTTIVVVSGHVGEDDRKRLLGIGADAVLRKPAYADQLAEILHHVRHGLRAAS